jgi:hypothetical protein
MAREGCTTVVVAGAVSDVGSTDEREVGRVTFAELVMTDSSDNQAARRSALVRRSTSIRLASETHSRSRAIRSQVAAAVRANLP